MTKRRTTGAGGEARSKKRQSQNAPVSPRSVLNSFTISPSLLLPPVCVQGGIDPEVNKKSNYLNKFLMSLDTWQSVSPCRVFVSDTNLHDTNLANTNTTRILIRSPHFHKYNVQPLNFWRVLFVSIRVYPCLTRKHEFISCLIRVDTNRHEYTNLPNTNTENSCHIRVVLFVSCTKFLGLEVDQVRRNFGVKR
ncbi:hypothetical protein LXL04_010902 [Taraxacum kok-saghyz]